MNILPHKSWHVYNKKNIEKVKRDEAKAREEEEAKAKRAAQAESEARLNLLRERARSRLELEGASSNLVRSEAPKHVNLFEDIEKNRDTQNEEYIAEKKAKDEKLERQLTMYLDKGVKDQVPWYSKAEYDRFGEGSKGTRFKSKHDDKDKHRRKRKAIEYNEDPLHSIRKELDDREQLKKERRYAHEKESKRSKKKTKTSSSSSSKSIEELRRQRLAREVAERSRAKQLLGEEEETRSRDTSEYTYSSQYNPTETALARKKSRHR
ncbi:hypothetical protein VTP01DRAFT_1427 [Rhizomucor pusillus]|uniref:uncharacterized protein n=1 Tax=Rhizomucor pusillus TaxID=4840 RepID=UPI003742B1ED